MTILHLAVGPLLQGRQLDYETFKGVPELC
jgi:hypothetical protein